MRVPGVRAELSSNGEVWTLPVTLYADDAVLLAENGHKLLKMVCELMLV